MGNDNRTLGEVIHDARVKLDLSLRDVTKELHITPSYLSDIENDRRIPSEEVLVKLADFLHLEYDDLMARAGRFGDEAVRYLMKTPAAGVLLRRLAKHQASDQTMAEVLKAADKEIERQKERKK